MERTPPRPRQVSLLLLCNMAAVLAIMALDYATPAGVVVGVLAAVPIILGSMSDDRRHIWFIFAVALVGKTIATLFGHGPISPALVWMPNRILAFIALPASAAVAFLLQKRRLEVAQARDQALAASELNRLLMSLLAHDLRSPLTISNQVVEYVEDALDSGRPIDRELLADVRARLRRSLRAIEIVLNLARTESKDEGERAAEAQVGVRVIEEIEAEIASFRQEAQARRKELLTRLEEVRDGYYRVNGLVLRQALAILVDNAIRYALPGPIRISARAFDGELTVRVEDTGPGLSTCRQSGSGGSGIGLELCRSLVRSAGGSLELERDSPEGTAFVLRLPAAPLSPG